MKLLFSLLLTSVGLNLLFTQTVDTIPFTLTTHNNIAIEGVLNDSDTVLLMFHTAANDVSLIMESAKNMHSVVWGEKIEGAKSWGGSGSQRVSSNNVLEISNFRWDSLTLFENKKSGPSTDGKFGPNLFEDKYIEVDFESKEMIIHNHLPDKISSFQAIPIKFENGHMFVESRCVIDGQEVPNNYLIHSGYSGEVLLDDTFVKRSGIADHVEITEVQDLKDSFGNVLKTKKGKLSEFYFGDIAIENVGVGFFEGAIGRQKMSVIGSGLLKRFHLIIDSQRAYIYVKV